MRLSLADFAFFLRQRPFYLVGYAIVAVMLFLAVFGPALTPFDPHTANAAVYLRPPSAVYWFGTDASGFDVFSRVIYAPRIDLVIAVTAALLSLAIGSPIGVLTGYFRGRVSETVARLFDMLQTFPVFVIALALVAMRGPATENVILALAILNTPIYVRLMRGQTLALSSRLFVEAARASGNTDFRLVMGHLLPNAIGPAIVQFSTNIGWAILLTSSLSFVGAGVRVPTAEWGAMIAAGAQNIITGEWWPSVFPGAAIGLTVFGFALVGESLELMLDPRRRA